jgi:hypothetical protein
MVHKAGILGLRPLEAKLECVCVCVHVCVHFGSCSLVSNQEKEQTCTQQREALPESHSRLSKDHRVRAPRSATWSETGLKRGDCYHIAILSLGEKSNCFKLE